MGIFSVVAAIAGGLKIGAQVLGAEKASAASKEAARVQEEAAQAAIAEERRQFDKTEANIAPFLAEGTGAVGKLCDVLLRGAPLEAPDIPGLEQARAAGLEAVEGSAFAKGEGLSGRTLASLFNQGQAFDFGASSDFLNRLSSLSGGGQTAATNLGSIGANKAGRVGNLLKDKGESRASGVVGANNAFQTGLTGVTQSLSSLFQPTG